MAEDIGSAEPGKLADLVVVGENPLENLKVLYGIGALKLTADNEIVRVGGIRYTIKDGIVFDAQRLLEDVRDMVQRAKTRRATRSRFRGWVTRPEILRGSSGRTGRHDYDERRSHQLRHLLFGVLPSD